MLWWIWLRSYHPYRCRFKWGLWALRIGIQISMEAILACHPARSTEWLDCHPKPCELWRIRTGPIRLCGSSFFHFKKKKKLINFSEIFGVKATCKEQFFVCVQLHQLSTFCRERTTPLVCVKATCVCATQPTTPCVLRLRRYSNN